MGTTREAYGRPVEGPTRPGLAEMSSAYSRGVAGGVARKQGFDFDRGAAA